MTYLAEQRKRSDSSVEEWQLALKPGDYAFRWWNTEGSDRVDPSSLSTITLYYEIIESPYEEDRGRLTASYRLVTGYSTVCPEGEMGTVHVGHLHGMLTKEEFETAKEFGWPSIMWVDMEK